MIFVGKPGLVVIDHKIKRELCRFDADGKLETKDKELIKRLKPHFPKEPTK